MADPNTCEQCGVSNHNKPNIIIRQSGKGTLVCQPCYDKIHPEETEAPRAEYYRSYIDREPKKEKKPIFSVVTGIALPPQDPQIVKINESISSSKTQEEKGTVRSGIRRLSR